MVSTRKIKKGDVCIPGYKCIDVTPDIIRQLNEQLNDMQIEGYDDNYDEEGNEIKITEDWKNLAIDISKIPTKKFSEIKELPFHDVNPFVYINDGEEGLFAYSSDMNFFEYRYHQVNSFHSYIYRFSSFNANIFLYNLFKYYDVPKNAYIKTTYQSEKEPKITSMLICFRSDLLMYIDGVDKGIIYYNPKDEKDEDSTFYTLLGLLKTVKRPKVIQNKIYVVYKTSHGFEKMGFDVSKVKINLDENYNTGFPEMSEKIIDGLNHKNKTNLVILSGEPGVGKTMFIRYLTSKLKKNIIFISTDMVDSITDPAFIPFLMRNNDSILIIEDAEPALEKRNTGGRSSAVSNVLNLTDGLLSDCLKISIVATFNTKEKNLDEALTRKGRLLMNYRFEKLAIDKSKVLLEKLGHKEVEVKEPMTLADIYFYGTDNNAKSNEPKKIGFKL